MVGRLLSRRLRGASLAGEPRLPLLGPLLAFTACWSWSPNAASQPAPPQAPDAGEQPAQSPEEADTPPAPTDEEPADQQPADQQPASQAPTEGDAEPPIAPPDEGSLDPAPTATLPLAESEGSSDDPSSGGAPDATPPADPFSSDSSSDLADPYVHGDPPDAPEPAKPQRVSITFSPLHLLLPAFEGTLELLVIPGLGVAGIVGAGSATVEGFDGTTERLSVFEAGGQVVWYPLAAFDKLQVGAEVLYVHVSGNVDDVEGYGAGLAVGPLAGYKLLTDAGFTLFVQGGFQYIALRAEARDSDGFTSEDSESRVIPLLNFNLGWSF